jgi:hypothetical protein
MYAPPKGSPEAQQMASTKLLPLLDQADKLLNDATGSLVGSAVDTAAGLVLEYYQGNILIIRKIQLICRTNLQQKKK